MAKYFRITRRWFQKVLDYNELPRGKVYYSVDGKSYHPANKNDFLDATPEDFDLKVGNCYHLSVTLQDTESNP